MTEREMRKFLERFEYLKLESKNLLIEGKYRPSKMGHQNKAHTDYDNRSEIDLIYEADIKIRNGKLIEHHIQIVESLISSLSELENEMIRMKYIKKMKADAVSYYSNYSIAQTKRIYLKAIKKITASYNKIVIEDKEVKHLIFG